MSTPPDFTRFFSLYWPYAHGLSNANAPEPLTVLEVGGTPQLRLERHGVRTGDVIIPITTHMGSLFVLGAMRLEGPAKGKPLMSLGPQRVGGTELVGFRFDRRLTTTEVRGWIVHGSRGARQTRPNPEGKLWRLGAIDGIRHLHEKTARMVWDVLQRPIVEPRRGPTIEQLEKQVRGQPWKRSRAAVLADAMSEAGDVRGRIMTLELEISAEADPRRASELDAELDELIDLNPQLLRRAGGFPWRRCWSSRRLLGFSVSGILKPTTRLRELLDSVFTAPFVLVRPISGISADQLRAAIGGQVTSRRYWVSAPDLAVERWLAASATCSFEATCSGHLRSPGSAYPLPLQRASGRFGRFFVRLPSRELELRLELPDGLHSISGIIAAWRTSFREHGAGQVQVRERPLP